VAGAAVMCLKYWRHSGGGDVQRGGEREGMEEKRRERLGRRSWIRYVRSIFLHVRTTDEDDYKIRKG
jgi:hypothetical protein